MVVVSWIGHREVGITTGDKYDRLAIGFLRIERLHFRNTIPWLLTSACLLGRREARKTLSAGCYHSQRQQYRYQYTFNLQFSIFNLQLLPTGFPGLQGLEEVITLVVHEDEGGEVLYLNLPYSLHTELRILYALDALDTAL